MKVRQPTPLAHGANAGTDERKNMSTSDELASLLDALHWHRQSCWVTDQVNLTGDLDENPTAAFDQLAGWVEAGVTDGWWKYGCAAVVGIDTYGESASAGVLFKHFGFTADNVAAVVRQVLKRR